MECLEYVIKMIDKLHTTLLFISLICLFVFSSCGNGLQIKKQNFEKMNTIFSGKFINGSVSSKKRSAIPFISIDTSVMDERSISSLLFLSDMFSASTDTISLKLDTNENLQVSYRDSLQVLRTEIFEGKLRRRGFYEIYLFKERIEIPPVISIIYGKVNIGRLRLGLTRERKLIVDAYLTHGGNIFIFAAGSSSRKQYLFEPIN